MKFDYHSYFRPTPKKARQFGLACKAVAAMAVPAVMTDYKYVGIGLFCVGILGEFLSNFFVEEPNK